MSARIGILFLWAEWWPFAGSDLITAPIADALILWGRMVLVVDAGAFLVGAIRAWYDARTEKQAAQDEKQKLDARAEEHMTILNEVEQRQLVWILRNGSERFSGYIGSSRLPNLDIISAPDPWVADVWIVNDAVWAARDAFLEQHKHLPQERELPTPPTIYA